MDKLCYTVNQIRQERQLHKKLRMPYPKKQAEQVGNFCGDNKIVG